MKLSSLSDDTLDLEIKRLVKSEREILSRILHHLREVERRRLFSVYGLSSLFAYATERLGYSEDQAARRISAMRLLKEIPEIEEKIETGALTLTHLAKAQTLFRQEKKVLRSRTVGEKLTLLTQLENSSKREAEKVLERESRLETSTKDLIRQPITLDQFTPETQIKLQRLLDLNAKSQFDLHDLISALADLGLEKQDPVKKAERATARATVRSTQKNVSEELETKTSPAPVRVNGARNVPSTGYSELGGDDLVGVNHTRNIPSAIRHALYMRDGGKCTICKSSRFLEIDHIIPFAKGGASDLKNLRLLCRSCNQRHAIEAYGQKKMSVFLKSPIASYRVH
jgi:hypothetical protein